MSKPSELTKTELLSKCHDAPPEYCIDNINKKKRTFVVTNICSACGKPFEITEELARKCGYVEPLE